MYNEIKLPYAEQERLQSEVLTWHANKRNQLILQTLSNGVTYQCVIDDDGVVHVYDREMSPNIHERKKEYDNTNGEKPDSITEELWIGQGNNGGRINIGENGRKSRKADSNDYFSVSSEWRSGGAGYSKNVAHDKRKPKEYKFNEDGSTEITYNDGTKIMYSDRDYVAY